MFYLLASWFFFSLAVIAHIVWSRKTRNPSRWLAMFCFIALIMLCGDVVFAGIFSHVVGNNSPGVATLPLYGTAIVFYVMLVPVYTLLYFAMLTDSPSKMILKKLQAEGTSTYEDLLKLLTYEEVISPRLQDLEAGGFIRRENDQYWLLRRGHGVAKLISLCQKICNRGLGG